MNKCVHFISPFFLFFEILSLWRSEEGEEQVYLIEENFPVKYNIGNYSL